MRDPGGGASLPTPTRADLPAQGPSDTSCSGNTRNLAFPCSAHLKHARAVLPGRRGPGEQAQHQHPSNAYFVKDLCYFVTNS